jgi:hypothetical protein
VTLQAHSRPSERALTPVWPSYQQLVPLQVAGSAVTATLHTASLRRRMGRHNGITIRAAFCLVVSDSSG